MAVHFGALAFTGTSSRRDQSYIWTNARLQSLIFLFIAAEFSMYVLIRQLVNTKEWLIACECRVKRLVLMIV